MNEKHSQAWWAQEESPPKVFHPEEVWSRVSIHDEIPKTQNDTAAS